MKPQIEATVERKIGFEEPMRLTKHNLMRIPEDDNFSFVERTKSVPSTLER